jgi:uncharacterized protein (DUF1330 family)
MSAYVISEVEMRDAADFETYRSIAAETISKYGGRYLIRGGAVSLIEGGPPRRRSSSSSFRRWNVCASGTPRRNTPRR